MSSKLTSRLDIWQALRDTMHFHLHVSSDSHNCQLRKERRVCSPRFSGKGIKGREVKLCPWIKKLQTGWVRPGTYIHTLVIFKSSFAMVSKIQKLLKMIETPPTHESIRTQIKNCYNKRLDGNFKFRK